MIYQINEVSNRDTQVLHFYRILRQESNTLGQLYRYEVPDCFTLPEPVAIDIDGEVWYEYSLPAPTKNDRIPYLEFASESESELKHIEDLIEVEATTDSLIIRGKTNELTSDTSVSVYWLPSLSYIEKMQGYIASQLDVLKARQAALLAGSAGLGLSSEYLVADGLVPNLVSIERDEIGLIYGDSHYKLSGSLEEQLLVNPSQYTVSGLLKSHNGKLTIQDYQNESKVYQGFYGGVLALSGKYKTLVLSNITSTIFLDEINADRIILENCPGVIFRNSLDKEGQSGVVKKLEVRNSYLTIYQPIQIQEIYCYRRSSVIQKKGIINSVGFVEAGSTLILDKPDLDNKMEDLRITRLQGLFYALNPEKDSYLDEIFMAQKPISFQRGSVDDPIPMSEAVVNIYVKHTKTPPSPTPEPPSGDIPDAPTDTHAGVIWNWFKNAGIPNVSNRPELIAGIIGNCQRESYDAIDVLGTGNGYYGPWCESDYNFPQYMISNGFAFHPYTTTPGNADAAIPYAFTWLTQQNSSWTTWLSTVIDSVANQTGVEGARAYAELFCVCVERCVGGPDPVLDSGVYQIMQNYYGGTVYTYQDLNGRRDAAEAIYKQFMGISE